MKKKVSSGIKGFFIAGCLFFLFLTPVFGGFNESLDILLAQDEMSAGAASYIVLVSRDKLDESSSFEEAYSAMRNTYPEKFKKDWDSPVTLGEFSLMIMLVYDYKGGLFYTMTKAPRYALPEMRFKGFVKGRAYARMLLSGERGVRILGRVIQYSGNSETGGGS